MPYMSRRIVVGCCALCLAEDVRLKHSHILPEFTFKACYDENHKLIELSLREPKPGKKVPLQKGYREYLLCDDCEGKFSKLEDYAARVLSGTAIHVDGKGENPVLTVQVDYARFKLFGMSILWRMGISTRSEFDAVKLGPHAEHLRAALFTEDPLAQDKYPFFLIAVLWNGAFEPGWITTPYPNRSGGHQTYNLVIAGFHYTFYVSSHRAEAAVLVVAPDTGGILNLPILPVRGIAYLAEYLARQGEVERGERERIRWNQEDD
jgi:hypothetical protein